MKKSNSLMQKVLMTLFSCLLCLTFIISLPFMVQSVNVLPQTKNDESQTNSSIDKTFEQDKAFQGRQLVYSYMDVFEKYYNKCTDILKAEGLENPFSLEEFASAYYAYEYNDDLDTFTNFAVECAKEYLGVVERDEDEFASQFPMARSIDNTFMLSATTYTVTPKSEFKLIPKYVDFDYSKIQAGDIIYERHGGVVALSGHNAIITNTNAQSEYGPYIQTIEAMPGELMFGGGVRYGFLDDNRMVRFSSIILRVHNATETQRKHAAFFAESQVGKPYLLLPVGDLIDSIYWYCSALVAAAYSSVGIDVAIYMNGNTAMHSPGLIHPRDIYNSFNTSVITLDSNFLQLAVVSKPRWNTWRIRVTNNSSVGINCEYNRKMCWFGDAKWWNKLKDIRTIWIPANSSVEVEVQENWMANSVTFSHIKNGKRYITHADSLTTNYGGHLKVYMNVV